MYFSVLQACCPGFVCQCNLWGANCKVNLYVFYNFADVVHCQNFFEITIPSRDVTYQTLPGQE
jgi:hypothetical protein